MVTQEQIAAVEKELRALPNKVRAETDWLFPKTEREEIKSALGTITMVTAPAHTRRMRYVICGCGVVLAQIITVTPKKDTPGAIIEGTKISPFTVVDFTDHAKADGFEDYGYLEDVDMEIDRNGLLHISSGYKDAEAAMENRQIAFRCKNGRPPMFMSARREAAMWLSAIRQTQEREAGHR